MEYILLVKNIRRRGIRMLIIKDVFKVKDEEERKKNLSQIIARIIKNKQRLV